MASTRPPAYLAPRGAVQHAHHERHRRRNGAHEERDAAARHDPDQQVTRTNFRDGYRFDLQFLLAVQHGSHHLAFHYEHL